MSSDKKANELLSYIRKLGSGGKTLSTKELSDLANLASSAKEETSIQERQEVKSQIEAILADKGFTIKELFATVYRNPFNPNETWVGRGKQPQWFKDALEKGITKESMYEGGESVPSPSKASRVAKAKKAKGKLYVNPENPAQTYSRGPYPPWLKAFKAKKGFDLKAIQA